MLPAARHPTAMLLRHCLRRATVPTLLATLVALGLAAATKPLVLSADDAIGAKSPWLHLPIFVAAAICATATASFWPLFAERRPGADWTLRLQRGRLQGCGAAMLGALLAQWLLCLPITTLFAKVLGTPTAAHSHFMLTPPQQPLLSERTPRLHFLVPTQIACGELMLRPLAGPPAGSLTASRVRALADDAPLGDASAEFDQTGQFVRITFAPRTVTAIDLVLEAGNVPLFFPPDSVELVGAAVHPNAWNGVFTAAIALVPTFLALAFACASGAAAALATVTTALLGILFVMTLGGIGPLDSAIRLQLGGRWLPNSAVFRQCLPSLAMGSMAMIGAMLLRRRHRR